MNVHKEKGFRVTNIFSLLILLPLLQTGESRYEAEKLVLHDE